ncbi:Calcium-dependent protein kinase isoform 2 [Phytophthora cinnamomi]|uniref:Calcium-dependent protein kinase isoform 2 n=1 Tax=Phytophthora cinnamomi TaxID=4785 RepID=UPI0035596D8D|nr:Calcium-dependent protein kinase isoform 2 [Phytophthora cinnamomi]
MVLNALELVDRQNEVIVACGKSRSGLPISIITTMLSVPFVPEELVPLIRPDTLDIVHVRRQRIVDCELAGRGNGPSEVFKDPVATDNDDAKARTNLRPRLTNNVI